MRKLIFITLLFISSFSFAQKEANIWYFGTYAGIDFNGAVPVALNDGQMFSVEGTASIADPSSGQLLFYTDGGTVWDSTHTIMPNGTGLMGTGSTTQAALIVHHPCGKGIYYIFTVEAETGSNGLRYSTVDMSLNSGKGDIVVKNFPLYTFPMAEKLTVAKHSNGIDIWVIAHEFGNNKFLSYPITYGGVGSPTVSNVGLLYSQYGDQYGQMKVSPDGTRIGSAINYTTSKVEMYDFDNSTGSLSNPMILYNIDDPWGLEFSPDNTKLYVSQYSALPRAIFQFDLTAGSDTAINNSRTLIYDLGSNAIRSLQLDPPKQKIYAASSDISYLGVINSPNSLGVSCNYINNGFQVATGTNTWAGLPNTVLTFELSVINCDSINGINNLVNNFNFKLYPNPTNQFATLEFSNPTKQNCSLTLYDLRGQIVRTIKNITTDKVEIERQSLASGLYFFQLRTDRQIIATGKLTIE